MKQTLNNEFAQRFQRFSEESHAKGSGTATSYVTALKKLDAALMDSGCFLLPGESVWDIRDIELREDIQEKIRMLDCLEQAIEARDDNPENLSEG